MPARQDIEFNDKDMNTTGWYLEGFGHQGQRWFVRLDRLPFIIGRQKDCDLQLAFAEISRRHAEIYDYDGELRIRECGSTNGTFINRQRLYEELALQHGDIIHFGSLEFRIANKQSNTAVPVGNPELTVSMSGKELPQGFVRCESEFNEMLQQRAVTPYFQPLVQLIGEKTIGYELLGRCDFPGLPQGPLSLLQIASSLQKEIELSELFRAVGLERAGTMEEKSYSLFLNTVPAEVRLSHLSRSLTALREQAPDLLLVLEIHEAAVTNRVTIRGLRALLDDLGIKLAYDDFGAGQARLVELIEVPPDWLKFDMVLVRGIHRQSPRSRQVLRTLVSMARDLGIKTIAEGVEVQEEIAVCTEIGFDVAQGYYYGKPAPSFIGY